MTGLFDLSGKIAIVTGGAGLIGRTLCEALAAHGATVIVVDTERERGETVATETAGTLEFHGVDVTSSAAVEGLVTDVLDTHGRIDVLVNSAYPSTPEYGKPYEEVTIEDWRANIDLQLNSYFLTAHRVSLVMKDQPSGGSIVNLGSTYGIQAPDFTVYEGLDMTSPVEYAGIKGGVINLTRYMASYLGDSGVRVNTLSPGGVFDGQDETFVERYEKRTPLGRMADPDDFKGPVVFLASEAARYVTGHNLVVDGGWTIK